MTSRLVYKTSKSGMSENGIRCFKVSGDFDVDVDAGSDRWERDSLAETRVSTDVKAR